MVSLNLSEVTRLQEELKKIKKNYYISKTNLCKKKSFILSLVPVIFRRDDDQIYGNVMIFDKIYVYLLVVAIEIRRCSVVNTTFYTSVRSLRIVIVIKF